jgi:tetratricopeptide (TPR) repeat protein
MGGRTPSRGRRALVSLANGVGAGFARTGRLGVAMRCHRWALRVADEDAALLIVRALTWNRLGVAEKTAGRYEEARDAYARAVALMGTADPEIVPADFRAAVAHNQAGLALACGDAAEAERHARAAVAARTIAGDSPSVIANDQVVLGETLAVQGRDDEARELFRLALESYEGAFGADHYEVGVTLVHLGPLEQRHDPELARQCYERALAIKERTRGRHHPEVGIVHNNLGALHRQEGRDDLARKHYEIAHSLLVRTYGADHPATRTCRANLQRLETGTPDSP